VRPVRAGRDGAGEQAHANVVLPTGQAKPLSGFFLTIAASGERKSACDHEALWPIRSRENALRTVSEADLPRYLDDQATRNQERSQILRSKGVAQEEKRDALAALGPPPQKPLLPILTCPEPTYEGLCHLLREAQPSIGLFSAEGGSFIGGHGMSADASERRTLRAIPPSNTMGHGCCRSSKRPCRSPSRS
jgi:hypothetical protein